MNFLYDCDLNYLKTYINNSLKSEQIKILKDIKIKERIINEDHYQFVWFIQKMSDEIVLLLLDEMGIEILSKSERIVDKINALITSCKNYVNKLFDNEKFLEMIINNINSLALYLSSVDDIASEKLINYLQKTNNMDLFYNRIFHNISLESQQNFVSNNIIPYEKLKHMIFRSHKKVSEYIIENDSRISGLEFSYNDIANLFVKKIDVYHLLRQTNILNEIVTCLSPIY